MALFGRDKLAKASEEVAEILKAVDNIRALQTAQREIADSIKRLGDRVQTLEIEFRALKAEIRADTLRETQGIVNAVQGQFYQRLQDIAVDVALLRQRSRADFDSPLRTRISGPSADGGAQPDSEG